MLQMATNGITPILSLLCDAFPDASTASVQFLTTLPCIFVALLCVCAQQLLARFRQRVLLCTGCALVLLGGGLSYLFHSSLYLLYAWSILIGIGIGLVIPQLPVLEKTYYDGVLRAKVIGWQNTSSNLGVIFMTLVGGALAVYDPYLNYLVYAIALAGLICTFAFLPAKSVQQELSDKQPQPLQLRTWGMIGIAVVTTLLFNTIPSNLSLLIAERSFGGVSFSGTAVAVLMASGAVTGLAFGKLSEKFGYWMLPIAFLVLTGAALVLALAQNIIALLAGCILGGMVIAFAMGQCICCICQITSGTQTALASGLAIGASQLGSFLSPIITLAAKLVSGNPSCAPRLILTALLSLVFSILLGLTYLSGKHKNSLPA